MRKLFLILLLSLVPAFSFAADVGVQSAPLSAQDTSDLARIETYLNELKSITADFMQVDENGGIMKGSIAIQRPGKMRVDYAPPSKNFIVADGRQVHIWNADLQEQTNIDESSSLADFILRDPIKLSGDVTVTAFKRYPAKMEVTLVQTNDPAAGSLTLIFEDHPLILRQWKVLDPQGHLTGVNLENERADIALPAKLFQYAPPNMGINKNSEAP